MSLTRVGRILIFVNLALGLAFCFWAYGLYANPRDMQAEAKIRTERMNELRKVEPAATASWRKAVADLVRVETRRPQLQAQYAQILQSLETGKPNLPIRAVAYVKGQMQIDPQSGLPFFAPVTAADGKPILGLDNLQRLRENYKTVQSKRAEVRQKADDQAKQEDQLTAQIKNLRLDLAREQLAEQKSVDEQEHLKPLLYNRQAEALLLGERKQAMETRLKELGGSSTSVARKP